MILKGSQRAGAKALALHLLRQDENDHVEIHQVRGFVRNNLMDALREAYAISRGTRCKQFLFSLSLSPPSSENVPVAVFERAIDQIEARLGLIGQPRAIVFHEKRGRRHAHCVWSRIDPRTMRSIQLSHFKLRLVELSRDLFIEHGWSMPRGLAKPEERSPLNFSLSEWQLAKRIERDPKRIKKAFQDSWAISDNAASFVRALAERGYFIAQGDRRGFVALDWRGEVYSISRWTDVRTRQLSDRLGYPSRYPTISAVRQEIGKKLEASRDRITGGLGLQFETANAALKTKRDRLVADQRSERKELDRRLSARARTEELTRAAKFARGLRAIWDWITGRSRKLRAENEAELRRCAERDAAERQRLIESQMKVRQELEREMQSMAERHEREKERIQVELSLSAKSDMQRQHSTRVSYRQRRREPERLKP